MMVEKPYDYWKHVLWSDESKFNLFGSDGKLMVWRSTMEEYDPKCTVPTVKHNGGSVMVWGCFSRSDVEDLRFTEGNMNRFLYSEILRKNLLQSCHRLGLENSFVFQHDNDPKQTAGLVKDWLKQKKIETLNWPPFSPDMNPIEHLWDELERRMKKHHLKKKKELKEILLKEWNNIGTDVREKLVDSVPNMYGYSTRY